MGLDGMEIMEWTGLGRNGMEWDEMEWNGIQELLGCLYSQE